MITVHVFWYVNVNVCYVWLITSQSVHYITTQSVLQLKMYIILYIKMCISKYIFYLKFQFYCIITYILNLKCAFQTPPTTASEIYRFISFHLSSTCPRKDLEKRRTKICWPRVDVYSQHATCFLSHSYITS